MHAKISVAGTRTRVSRVRAEYPNHLDYNGSLYTVTCLVERLPTPVSDIVFCSIKKNTKKKEIEVLHFQHPSQSLE